MEIPTPLDPLYSSTNYRLLGKQQWLFPKALREVEASGGSTLVHPAIFPRTHDTSSAAAYEPAPRLRGLAAARDMEAGMTVLEVPRE